MAEINGAQTSSAKEVCAPRAQTSLAEVCALRVLLVIMMISQ